MKGRSLSVILVTMLSVTACEAVSVQVPPEVDLKGIKMVAVVTTDFPTDLAPVGVLLRVETASEIRRVLPALTVVERSEESDATLRLEVASHGIGPASFYTNVNTDGQAWCTAWQDAFLIVNGTILAGPKPNQLWQELLEGRRRITLSCVPNRGPVGALTSPGILDRQLVKDIISELGRKLAGYTRREFRPLTGPTPQPGASPGDGGSH